MKREIFLNRLTGTSQGVCNSNNEFVGVEFSRKRECLLSAGSDNSFVIERKTAMEKKLRFSSYCS